jgi:hypothetical protein
VKRLVALTLAFLAVLVTPATADVFDDNPATASRGGNDIWVFARDSSGAILERHWTSRGWTDWSSLGGQATSGPAAVGYGNAMHVFVRGPDGATYQNTFDRGAWSGWKSLGGVSTSAPAAVVRRGPQGYIDLAIKGTDNAIYFQTFVPGVGWSGWASRGGNLTSAPALNSQSPGIVNIWARGTDGAVKQMAWNGTAWSEWLDLGGGIIGAPAAISRAENLLNLYVRGANNATYQRSWSPAGWSGWFLMDSNAISSSPAAGGHGSTQEWLFARGGSGLLFQEWRADSGWTSWGDFGAIALPAPPPTPVPTEPAPDGEVGLETGLRCTPPGGRARVKVTIRKPKGRQKARVSKIVFFTKGKGRAVKVDRRSPYVVRIKINRPAGSTGRVYARVYYRRSANGKLHRKTVSRRYVVCR